MSAHHDADLQVGRTTSAVLWALVLAVAAVTLAGLVVLRPDGEVVRSTRVENPYAGLRLLDGTVTGTRALPCDQVGAESGGEGVVPADPGTAPGTDPGGAASDCAVAVVAVPGAGGTTSAEVPVPVEVVRAGLGAGDPVRLAVYPAQDGVPPAYAFVGYERRLPLGLLAGLFAVLVVAVARWKGLAALGGVAVAFVVVAQFLLPALRTGGPPLPLALVTASAIMLPVLYLAHGVSARTTTALLGTVAGLAVTAGLAAWATGAAHLDGLVSDEDFELSRLTTGAGLGGIVLCGVVVAGLGVLNDVTVTQASAVWEVKAHAPHLGVRALFASGMRVGRDHLASTVYTIVFAYAGAALPTLLLVDLYAQPVGQVLTGGDVAEEVVRTLVGSVGLVLAIPLTTLVAALVASRGRPVRPVEDGGPQVADLRPVDAVTT
ncbi:YibE/F family protein [Kineosporia sp. A_224]|uniref:YibE/F family protein n=1 Tax=Kineosporia sp. A_224 TaxID=1962180 RepID=UPI0018E98F6E|nr:YibE/F family protein [Kineosporia sp. A_224]